MKYSAQQIAQRIKSVHDNVILDESTYCGTNNKARFIDSSYGEWWAKPSSVLSGSQHRERFKAEQSARKALSINEIKKRLVDRGDNITIDESTYINATTKARFIDPEYGEWWAEPRTIVGKSQQHMHPARAMKSRIANKTKYLTKEDRKKQKRKYYEKNVKQRLKSDINFRLAKRLRGRLNMAIKSGFKTGSAIRDLGCSIEELKKHLESQFQPGMSWENWSKDGWHIDHIEPLSRSDLTLEDNVRRLCHYTNLRPMWAIENMKKYNR